MMAEGLRPTGIDVIGDVPWGTHFCQFYEHKEDLVDILVPYFKAGLENNEFCMWITCAPLDVDEAKVGLAAVVPDLDRYIASGQLEIIAHSDWYVLDGCFDSERVLGGWVEKLEAALAMGFQGLRLTGNTFWLEESDWADFAEYEAAVDSVIGKYRMIAMCTYSLDKCGAPEIMDVMNNHQFALIRRGKRWETVESAQRKRLGEALLASEARYRQANEVLKAQAEELTAQSEELRGTNESLLEAQDALSKSEERYRFLFERIDEGFALREMIFDQEGKVHDYRFLDVNPAFERLSGLPRERLVGKTASEVLPRIEAAWLDTFAEVVQTGRPARFELHSHALDRFYEVIAYRSEQGQVATLLVDTTERTRAERERERLLKQEEEFVSIAAHELRTPMTAMKGFAQLLMRRAQRLPDGPEWLAQLSRIDDQVDRMSDLVARLLDVSRIQLGRLDLKPAAVDLVRVAEEAATEAQMTTTKHRVLVRPDCPEAVGEWEGNRLRQVFGNLLSNAVSYSPQGGDIVVGLWTKGSEAFVTVRDEGVGIPREAIGSLFERYYRHDEAVRARPVGMGLGLFISHGIVAAHGGRMWVESAVGEGTTFYFTLPLAQRLPGEDARAEVKPD